MPALANPTVVGAGDERDERHDDLRVRTVLVQ